NGLAEQALTGRPVICFVASPWGTHSTPSADSTSPRRPCRSRSHRHRLRPAPRPPDLVRCPSPREHHRGFFGHTPRPIRLVDLLRLPPPRGRHEPRHRRRREELGPVADGPYALGLPGLHFPRLGR